MRDTAEHATAIEAVARIRGFLLAEEGRPRRDPQTRTANSLEVEVVNADGDVQSVEIIECSSPPRDRVSHVLDSNTPSTASDQDTFIDQLIETECRLLLELVRQEDAGTAVKTAMATASEDEIGVLAEEPTLLFLRDILAKRERSSEPRAPSRAAINRFLRAGLGAVELIQGTPLQSAFTQWSDARRVLIEGNMRLVGKFASQRSKRLTSHDSIRTGAIGLSSALDRFEPSRGTRFSTYAVHWISQAVSRAADSYSRPIRLPSHCTDLLHRLFRQPLETEEALALAAHNTAITVESARTLLSHAVPSLSSAQECPGAGNWIEDRLFDTARLSLSAQAVNGSLRDRLRLYESLLGHCRARDRTILDARLAIGNARPRTLEEIGEDLHVTRERIRQIETKTLESMRWRLRRLLHKDPELGGLFNA